MMMNDELGMRRKVVFLAYLELLCTSYLVKRSKGNHDKTQDREEVSGKRV
jgi:hypothetical protein